MLTPTTVPGSAHGSMIIRSRIPPPLPFQRAITQAVSTPTTIEAAFATADIWEETSSGRRLRGGVKMSTQITPPEYALQSGVGSGTHPRGRRPRLAAHRHTAGARRGAADVAQGGRAARKR